MLLLKGNLDIWDLENLSKGPVLKIHGHESIINSIDGVGGLGEGAGSPEIVTGSRDGRVKVWDVRVRDKPVACMEPRKDSAGVLQKRYKLNSNKTIKSTLQKPRCILGTVGVFRLAMHTMNLNAVLRLVTTMEM